MASKRPSGVGHHPGTDQSYSHQGGLHQAGQLSNGIGISKYDLLCLFKDIWGRKDVEIVSVDTNGVDKSIAKSARFGYEVPGYREMLKDLYAWMQAHKDMYRQYWER